MLKYSFFIVIAIILLATSVSADWGKCQKVSTKQEFNLAKYMGRWYEIARFDNVMERDGVCTQANYTINPKEPTQVLVTNSELLNGNLTIVTGVGYCPDDKEPAKLLVSVGGNPFYAPYWIIDTDYNNYAMVFSCFSVLGVYHYEIAWILGRQRQLSQQTLSDIMVAFKKQGIDSSKFILTKQVGCK
ncbi:hypothetical protein ABK040_006177 [Willaertia magna]